MLENSLFIGTVGAFFFVPANPTAKKSPKWPPRAPPLPGTRQEGEIGLLFALGAFQGRIWSQNWTPNGTNNHSTIDLGAQGPPKSRREAEFEALRGPKAHEKAVRKYWSKGLSKQLYARSTNDPWLSGRYWGRSPTGDNNTRLYQSLLYNVYI